MVEKLVRLGAQVRAFRQSAGFSLSELSTRAKVTEDELESLERGENRLPPDRLESIIRALDLTLIDGMALRSLQ